MNKWLSSLSYTLVILIAILLLLPLLFGLLAESKCRKMVETINNTTLLSAKIIDYQRGWFRAHAITQIALDKLKLPEQDSTSLTIMADITHGPILMDWAKFHFAQALINAEVNLNNTAPNHWLNLIVDKRAIANLNIKFKLNGNTAIQLDSPPLTYHNQELSLNWHGLKIRSAYSPLYNQVKSTINLSGVELKTKEYNLQLGEISGTYEGKQAKSGMWFGERNLQLSSFTITNANNRTTAWNNVNFHNLIASDDNNLTNLVTTITADKLTINDALYEQNKLDLEVNKFDPVLLAKLQQQLFSTKILSSPTNISFDLLMTILNSGSEIKIKQLDTSTPWGKLFTNAKITFSHQTDNIGLFAAITGSAINTKIKAEPALVLHLLEKFYQTIPTKQPNNPAQQAKTLLTDWQQTGKLLPSNEDPYLHLTLEYQNNEILINGKQLVLAIKP